MRTLVLEPHFKQNRVQQRSAPARLEEGMGLARAIDLVIADGMIIPLQSARPATLFGEGKIEEIHAHITSLEVELVVVNGSLSPVQQRNLERAWSCKVIDRTALILEIFGARARTSEGKLQVELASLNYQKSRLVRSWTHLERQRGGFGFLGGPGESQIELDRRMIRDRIAKIKKELETVVRTRELHRKVRREVPYPIVALVGYTNAGKSTLFNRLTNANVEAVDKLFATLDPTMRSMKMPTGGTVILSDTVGFISDLPHDLIAAFRATLEEVLEADILLHVRDIATDESDAEQQDVEKVLKELFGDVPIQDYMIEIWNKIDALDEHQRMEMGARRNAGIGASAIVPVSAITGEGIAQLQEAINNMLDARIYQTASFTLPVSDGKRLAWLYSHGRVTDKQEGEEVIRLTVMLTPENMARFEKMSADELSDVT